MQVIVFAISGNLFKSSLHKPSLSVLNDHTLKQLKSVCTYVDVHTLEACRTQRDKQHRKWTLNIEP